MVLSAFLPNVPVMAQAHSKKPTQKVTPVVVMKSKVKQDLFFAPIEVSCTRFPDQINTDEETSFHDDRNFTVRVHAQTKPEAWTQFKAAVCGALSRLGLDELTEDRKQRLPESYDTGLFAITNPLGPGPWVTFWPKDQESFARILQKITWIGNRDDGLYKLTLQGAWVVVHPVQFQFDGPHCYVNAHLEIGVGGIQVGVPSKLNLQGLPTLPDERNSLELVRWIKTALENADAKRQN